MLNRSSEKDSSKVKQRTSSRVLNNDLAFVIPNRKSRILFQNKTKEDQKADKQNDDEKEILRKKAKANFLEQITTSVSADLS